MNDIVNRRWNITEDLTTVYTGQIWEYFFVVHEFTISSKAAGSGGP